MYKAAAGFPGEPVLLSAIGSVVIVIRSNSNSNSNNGLNCNSNTSRSNSNDSNHSSIYTQGMNTVAFYTISLYYGVRQCCAAWCNLYIEGYCAMAAEGFMIWLMRAQSH